MTITLRFPLMYAFFNTLEGFDLIIAQLNRFSGSHDVQEENDSSTRRKRNLNGLNPFNWFIRGSSLRLLTLSFEV